jgi:hypothetical protein
MRFIGMTVYLIPGYTTPSQPGRHSGGAKPLERLRFWSFEQEHSFDFEFWSTMLITFIPVISFTWWWLTWHYALKKKYSGEYTLTNDAGDLFNQGFFSDNTKELFF